MAWVIGTTVAGAAFGNTGKLYLGRPTAGAFGKTRELTLPTGTTGIDRPGSGCIYDGKFYGVGSWSNDIVIDSHYRAHVQGIRPPSQVPTLAAAAGPGVTGTMVVYVRFRDSVTGEVSPLSGASAPVALVNQSRTTANIQATSSDPRVDQIEILVSVNGSLPRVATRRDLGVTTVTEIVATLALGEVAPDTFEPMKFGMVNAIYHQRQCVAGNPKFPDTLFVSAYGYPERYEGLSFKTERGEPIVALANVDAGDTLLAFTPVNCYYLRGYTSSDLVFKPLNGGVGAINHRGIVDVDGILWVPTERGFYIYNGGFHNVSGDIESFWTDLFQAHEASCKNGFGLHNPEDQTYSFFLSDEYDDNPLVIPDPDNKMVGLALVADYRATQPQASGSMTGAAWSFDAFGKVPTAASPLAYPGSKKRRGYIGTDEAVVWAMNPDADHNLTTDPYGARMWKRLPHYTYGDPGGADSEGKELVSLWTYAYAESDEWTVYAKGGDDEAWKQGIPDNVTFYWKDEVGASALTEVIATFTYVRAPKTTHFHRPMRVSGHGHTLEYTVPTPSASYHWRGVGGKWEASSHAYRGTVSKTGAGS
jgi:hypothetical protein